MVFVDLDFQSPSFGCKLFSGSTLLNRPPNLPQTVISEVTTQRQMSKAQVQLNIYSFSACITSAEKSTLWSLALTYVKHMKQSTIQPNVVNLNAALSAFSKEGGHQWPLAISLWAKICLEIEPNVISFTTAMTSHITMWSWPRSLNFLELMPQTNVAPNVFTFSTAINICERGEWPWATALLEKMSKDFHLQPNLVCFNVLGPNNRYLMIFINDNPP